jgi:hypothetical protein
VTINTLAVPTKLYSRQRTTRKDTGIIISQRMLFNEARIAYECYRGFVPGMSKCKLKSTSDKEELNEADYDENRDQLEEEQEEQTGEVISSVTTNQVF